MWLEEDHYVAEDFLHVLALMEEEKKANNPKVLCRERKTTINPLSSLIFYAWEHI